MSLLSLLRFVFLLLALFVYPFVLGIPWTSILPKNNTARILACFPVGFFIEIGLFELILFPLGFFRLPFSSVCIAFAILLTAGCVISLLYASKYKPIQFGRVQRVTALQGVYFGVFAILLGIQICNACRLDTTYMSYDAAIYVSYAGDAVYSDRLLMLHPDTGLFMGFDPHRAMQAYIFFPAFLSLFSSIPVTVMCRTILEMYNIVLAYVTYGYLGKVIFKERENVLIFLIVMCVLSIFGYYSHYSVTFRILGPNYQGKAVLAVSFFPLLFALFIQKLGKRYDLRFGVLLMLMSAAAVSLSMFGAVTMIVNSVIVILLGVVRQSDRWKKLLYVPWACVLPSLCISVFLLYKCIKW